MDAQDADTKMATNEKTYWVAWHPEKGYLMNDDFGHSHLCVFESITGALYEINDKLFNSKGWEVVPIFLVKTKFEHERLYPPR